ncbi:hypothetical protein B5807_10091 [Epicoccum nigrum]|uniref:Uncharacterized protein n=1 Tax=Epicoccum nigrum TaxID=105696 RepID=A0A1Y2LTG3_EPING|nr:hypothetical protein B5807_10091 [Epicoccum nigrum]
MKSWNPLGNEPTVYYYPSSPTDSDDGDDGLRFLPCLDMIFAAKSSRRSARRLARMQQRRRCVAARLDQRIMEDQPRVEASHPVGENQETHTPMKSVKTRMSRMPGAYPESPPSDVETVPPVTEIAREPAMEIAPEEGEAHVPPSSHPLPSQQTTFYPDLPIPRQPPSPLKRKRSFVQPGIRDALGDGEACSRVASEEKRARMQPTVEDVSDEGDEYVETAYAVPPRQPANPSPDPDLSTQRHPPSPALPKNTVPANQVPTLGPRSIWHDYFIALDRDCETRVEEALRRAVPTPSRTKCARHRRMSTETEAWFAYLEDDCDADPMEYVHRIEEAKRYGIPVSRPAAPERKKKKKKSKPTTPVANK